MDASVCFFPRVLRAVYKIHRSESPEEEEGTILVQTSDFAFVNFHIYTIET
jgi:hypothetical protein